MKPTSTVTKHLTHSRRRSRGFALVVTLSLMILLTVIAVGLRDGSPRIAKDRPASR